MLKVRLLGKFSIECDSQSVTLSSRAAQSLFAYLILTAGTLHRREKLAGMLWPDSSEEKARAYLRHELWRIRKALTAVSSFDYLASDDIHISFNASSEFWLDVTALKKLGESAPIPDFMEALSLYQGQFLPDFYDEWITQEREHVQVLCEQKMARLLDILEQEKRWNDVLIWAEEWISQPGAPEAAYRSLMVAYKALGDHAKVHSTYERCKQALCELDLEPSEKTRMLVTRRTNTLHIPIPLTSFIGREKELEEVENLMSKSRLVTLTGSGGVGKTRLAIQVVADLLDQFPDGVWFLDLAPLIDPLLVPNTLAAVLDLSLMGDSDLSYTDLITGYLRSRRALIIFDNCEHLIEPCAQLAHSLLTSCEHLSVLATSREALRVSGEIPYRVPSLRLPSLDIESIIDALANIESVQLFIERAAVVSQDFTIGPHNAFAIAQICKRLGGIPLAIELAAARVNLLTVEQILIRLDDRFNLLTGGLRSALPRHQTLRATIEWSYDLLSEKERLLFQRLAVFVGGWTLEAAEAVCSGEGIAASEVLDFLSQLVDKSLVQVENSSSPGRSLRYRRLETIRQFAYEKFASSSDREQIRAKHLVYFLKLAQQAELEYPSEKMIEWVRKLENEHENMHAALEWSLHGNVTAGQQLAGALFWWWDKSGNLVEGYDWMRKMLDASRNVEPAIRAKLLSEAGWLANLLSFTEQSILLTEESLALYRQLGDKEGIAFALSSLGIHAFYRSDFEQARALCEESYALYREKRNKLGMKRALSGLAGTASVQGDFTQAQKFYEEGLMLAREMGYMNDIGSTLYFMGNLAVSQGNASRAMELYKEALEVMKVVKNKRIISWIFGAMGSIALSSGNFERSRLLIVEAMEIYRQIGNQAGMAYSLHYLACGARLQGDYARARSLYIESLQLLKHLGNESDVAEYLIGVGQLIAAQGDFEVFARLQGTAEGAVPHINKMTDPFFLTETEKFIELAQASLGNEVYNAAWEAGRQMSLREGVAYALRELQQLDSKRW